MAEYKSSYTGSQIDAGIGKANTAVQPAALENYQTKIDSSHKLSADLISDGETNKTVTETEKTTWSGKSVVSGTNDGTNWSTITINGTTKSIPVGEGGSSISVKEIDYSNPEDWDSEEEQPTAEVIDDIIANKYTLIHIYNIPFGGDVVVEMYLVSASMIDVEEEGAARYYYKFDEGDSEEGEPPFIEQYLFAHPEGDDAVMAVEGFKLGTYIDSSHKLSADLVDDTSATNKFVTSAEKSTWNSKSTVIANPTLIGTETSLQSIQIGNVKYNISENTALVKKVVSGTSLEVNDNFDESIQNLKIYAKSEGTQKTTTAITINEPGYLKYDTKEIMTTPTTSSHSDYISVSPGDIIQFVSAKTRSSGCCLITYNSSKTAIESYFRGVSGDSTVHDYSGEYFIVPNGVSYVVVAGLNTSSGAVSENPSANVIYITSYNNLFDINDFDWTGTSGYISSAGIWTNSSSFNNIFCITQMKIPVVAGHRFVFKNLNTNQLENSIIGIHWFDNTYTSVDTTNTTTAQSSWISRNCGVLLSEGVFTAPTGATYCEFQLACASSETGTTDEAKIINSNSNVQLFDLDDAGVNGFGTIYINSSQTTSGAQSVDLSSVSATSSNDYIYKKSSDDFWYSNVSEVETKLSSSLQTALNGLELEGVNVTSYLWMSNGTLIELTYNYLETIDKDKKQLKILLLTNSFGQDSFSYVPSIVNRLAGDDVNITVGILYIGGCSLEGHWQEINGNTTAYTYYEATNNGAWSTGVTSNALSKLKKEDWDLFIFNQVSTKTVDETSFSPYLNNIINWVYTNTNKPIKIGMFFGGTYPSSNPSLTIETMYTQSVPVLQDILDDYPIEIFFPNGTAIQNARTNNTLDALGDSGHLLYDSKHAQEGIPCLIEAYTVVLGLFKILGLEHKSIIGDVPVIDAAWISTHNIPGSHGNPAGMTSSNILLAQKCAIMAHKKPFEVTTIE